jgi:hypothetical protein
MAQSVSTLRPDWIKQAREYFQTFLEATRFPHPVRDGSSGRAFTYPEWLVMFIAVLAVKGKAKTYPEIHRLTLQSILGDHCGRHGVATYFRIATPVSFAKGWASP